MNAKLGKIAGVFAVTFIGAAAVFGDSRIGADSQHSQGRNDKATTPDALPIMTYAVIDMSGTSVTDPVTFVALGDDGRAAFAADGPTASDGEKITVKTFTSGQVNDAGMYYTRQLLPKQWRSLSPQYLRSNGDMLGSEQVYTDPNPSADNPTDPSEFPGTFSGGFSVTQGVVTDLGTPQPYFYDSPDAITAILQQGSGLPGTLGPKPGGALYAASEAGYAISGGYSSITAQPVFHVIAGGPYYGWGFVWEIISDGDITFFDPKTPSSVPDVPGPPTSTEFVRQSLPSALSQELNDKGAIISQDGSQWWNGETLASTGLPAPTLSATYFWSLTNENRLVGELNNGDPTKGFLWENGNYQLFSQLLASQPLLGPAYASQFSNIVPLLASNENATDHSYNIVTSAVVSGTPKLVLWKNVQPPPLADGTQPPRQWQLYEMRFPANVQWQNLQVINSSGVIAAIGNAGTGDNHALLLVPVDYQQIAPNSGFDHVNIPPWLMVPQNGNNFANALTPASNTFTLGFKMQPTTASETCSPSITASPLQTITVNGINPGSTSHILVACGPQISKGAPLNIDVKCYQYKYVMLHEIVQSDGVHADLYPQTCPSANALQTFLNAVYGAQTNTYFYVGFQLHKVNYDKNHNGALDIDVGDSPTAYDEFQSSISNFKVSYDFNIYFVNRFITYNNGKVLSNPGYEPLGRAFRTGDYAVVEDNPAYMSMFPWSNRSLQVITHEIGHLFGLSHADSQTDYITGGPNPTYLESDMDQISRLMFSVGQVDPNVNKRLIKQEWDIINSLNTTNATP